MATVDLVIRRMDELRRDRNMTWNALATSAGIAPSTLKNIYNGKSRNPGIVNAQEHLQRKKQESGNRHDQNDLRRHGSEPI